MSSHTVHCIHPTVLLHKGRALHIAHMCTQKQCTCQHETHINVCCQSKALIYILLLHLGDFHNFLLLGGFENTKQPSMLRLLQTFCRVWLVAVAVSAITLTSHGIIDLISEMLWNSVRKWSPLHIITTTGSHNELHRPPVHSCNCKPTASKNIYNTTVYLHRKGINEL